MSFLVQKDIKEFIKNKKFLKPKEIQEKFNLTTSTIRRYLIKLEEEGFVKRPFGEVIYNEKRNYIDKVAIEEVKINKEGKRDIAKTAAILAKEYVNVYVDSGSSCFHLLEFLDPSVNLYTNSIYNAMRAIDLGFEKVNIIGGQIKSKSLATVTTDLRSLDNMKFQIAFLGVNGIDENGRLTTPDMVQGIMKTFIADHSELVVVLATEEKFGYRTFYDFTPKDRSILVVTDSQKQREYEFLNIIRVKKSEEDENKEKETQE
ncbi:DeoR/GlpR transcriptional regulator [Mycoplasma procyoni]|nr:DeoR/GlpR transcriptional regulator [Mycoplasma procyoni]